MEERANRYTPEWQRLAETLRHVMRAGLNEQDAKTDLCNAIADGAVAVRVKVAGSASIGAGQVFGPTLVVVPSHLDPTDLDWDRSCPLMPWAIRRTVSQEYMGGGSGDGRPIALLETPHRGCETNLGRHLTSDPPPDRTKNRRSRQPRLPLRTKSDPIRAIVRSADGSRNEWPAGRII